ncbi:hypothetical protein C8R44DRAFT_672048 [Mycena epipterygia]|nr:hypothetical protein C8R44DRAFT_672048 [Mycena epipterygia]
MCYPSVQYLLHSCGHEKPGQRVTVDCRRSNCRYSSAHPSVCSNCVNTCQQWLMPPQRASGGTSPNMCWNCVNPGRRG